MDPWGIVYIKEAQDDLDSLDGSQRIEVLKSIKKVSQNPLPQNEGGYGKPLGNTPATHLSGLLKIKLKKAGIRVVYKLVVKDEVMKIIVIGIRDESHVYKEAAKRLRDIEE